MSGRDVNRGSSQAEVGHWWLKIPWALQPGHQGTRPGAFRGTWAQEAHSCFPPVPCQGGRLSLFGKCQKCSTGNSSGCQGD